MKTIDLKGVQIEFYDSAEDLPIRRYQKFNKFLMIDNEVGSDFIDFNKRTAKAVDFLRNKMLEQAVQELENRRQMVYNSFMEYAPRDRALAILVRSIDGKLVSEFSADALDEVIDKLDSLELSKMKADQIVDESKKKIEKELEMYFPEQFKRSGQLEYNSLWLGMMREELRGIIEDTDVDLTNHRKNMLILDKPNSWNVKSKHSMEREMEVGFEKFLIGVSELTSESTDTMTTYKFYALNEYIADKNKSLKDGRKNHKV